MKCAWLSMCVVLAGSVLAQAEPISPTGEKIVLFNGENLDGWYTWLTESGYEDPKKVFTVEDGLLRVSGDGWGYVVTKDEYKDYHLVFDFKWGDKTYGKREDRARDSGVLFHCIGPDGGASSWMTSIEANIIEGGTGDFIFVMGKDENDQPLNVSLTCEVRQSPTGQYIWEKGGERITFNRDFRKRVNWFGRDPEWQDVKGFRGKNDVEKPVGEWNRMEVRCDGGKVEVYLNGVKVNEGFDGQPRAGKILFQTEGAELFYRNIVLYPLDQRPSGQ